MSAESSRGRVWYAIVALVAVLALVAAAAVVYLAARPAATRYAAMFDSVIGVYPGNEVRMLGVPVGAVDELRPEGRLVRVEFHIDSGIQVPAQAFAMVVSPTVVADRFIQLPVYDGGPTLPEGSVIPADRTSSPAEFDDLLASVQKLTTSLGPQGVNQNGALSEALKTTADNLEGNGQRLNTTLDNVSQAVNTLNGSREDLFGTVRNLQSFTTNLKQNDGKVREFTRQFAEVNDFLAGEREDIGTSLNELSETLGEVAVFVRDNRADIRSNVDKLAEILDTVNDERLALEQTLDTAPQALSGLLGVYNARSGTLDTRVNLTQVLICLILGRLNDTLQLPLPAPILMALGAVVQTFAGLIQTVVPGGLAGCAALPTGAAAATSPDPGAANPVPALPNPLAPNVTGAKPQARSTIPPARQPSGTTPGAPPLPMMLGGGR